MHEGYIYSRVLKWVTKEEDENGDPKEKRRIQHVILDMSSKYCPFEVI